MLKIKNLYKLISVGLVSLSLFVLGFSFALAQDIPVVDQDASLTITSIEAKVVTVVNYVISLIAIVAVAMIIYAGYLYISSGGDEKKLVQAKSLILYAVIGLVVVVVSYSIVGFVNSFV